MKIKTPFSIVAGELKEMLYMEISFETINSMDKSICHYYHRS